MGKGNVDIINKVIALDKELHSGMSLFEMTQQEVDDILKFQIQKIVAHVQQRYGKAEVYLALSK